MLRRTAHLPNIQGAQELLSFLRDDLNWPIPEDAISDELTFDWTNEDLRLPEYAAERLRGGTIHQVRPLVPAQPWGIFVVEFADAHVYRTSLRQILRGLVPNRR